ncbi:MAG: hypothetical protein ACFCUT_03615 [Kiloniellaceae bacterium]
MNTLPDLTDEERNWLSQETLLAYVVVNLALGYLPLDRPIRDSVRLPNWQALREAIRKGQIDGATNPPGSGPCLHSMLPLAGLMSFLARPRLGPSWHWLRAFVEKWAGVHKDIYGEDPAAGLKRALSSQVSRNRCQNWLHQLMRDDPAPGKKKPHYQQEARQRFGVSIRQFNQLWAIAATNNPKWSAPGRKKARVPDS